MGRSGHPQGYHDQPRTDVARLIPIQAVRILDVGCGSGGLGRGLLAEGRAIEMHGVEIDAEAAARARADYGWVVEGDAEEAPLPAPEGFFDCVVYGDILEHFVNPGDVLASHLRHLRPGGWVVASVPNMRNARVLVRLALRGRWDYFEAGIADWSHLRFWTSRTFREFLQWHGLEVLRIDLPPYSRRAKALRIASFGLLRDFLSFKIYAVARKPAG